jgi:magnesium transporter
MKTRFFFYAALAVFCAQPMTAQNKIMKVFTLVSLMLMPPTLIASFFGMNVRFGWFFEHSGWAWVIIVLMMLASFYVIFRIFKSRNMF